MIKRGGVVWTIWNVIVAALFITLGIVTMVNSGNKDFQNVIILIAGILVIVDASLRLLTQVINFVRVNAVATVVKTNYTAAIAGASELSIGILLILVSRGESSLLQTLMQYLALFIGILLLVLGAVGLIFAIVAMIKKSYTVGRGILEIVLSALIVTGGILVLVYANQEGMVQFIFVLYGIFFTLVGVALLCGSIALAIAAHRMDKEAKEQENVDPAAPQAEVIEHEEAKEEHPEEPKENEEKKDE